MSAIFTKRLVVFCAALSATAATVLAASAPPPAAKHVRYVSAAPTALFD